MSQPILHQGMCDASAAVAVSSNLFLAADDEGNQLRLFDADAGGGPLKQYDFSRFLGLTGKHPEVDFEGGAWLGDTVYWISSHGRNREGKYRENRHCFFGVQVRQTGDAVEVTPVGRSSRRLLDALVLDSRLRPFNLGAASGRPPKSKGGLNIEGLCATPDNHLWIGFRNPIPDGLALVVPLLNPGEVVRGMPARLGDPRRFDLGGLGIRDLGFHNGEIFILAGAHDTEDKFALYRWSNDSEPPRKMPDVAFKNLNPEALVFYTNRVAFQVLSDDGTRKADGIRCKDLVDPGRKRFRSVWVNP